MEVRTARHIGFCPGVKRAIEITERALERSEGPVLTLGPLIHNPQVVAMLERLGVEVMEDRPSALEEKDLAGKTVVIRSHGAPPSTFDLLRRRGAAVIDATCPNVKRAQKGAAELVKDGFSLLVVGSSDHPEVRAILGWVDGRADVVADREAMDAWWKGGGKRRRRVGVIGQTTIDLELFRELVNVMLGRVPDLRVIDTLCHSTIARQQEARRLALSSDLVLVMGGRNSSNTSFLRKICLLCGTPALQLETADELDIEALRRVRNLAVLGGASTPDWIVDGVVEKIRRAFP
jgi:(E)-4-hydroxy-3-methyl-but-2-enyl pyrophosphate reductase